MKSILADVYNIGSSEIRLVYDIEQFWIGLKNGKVILFWTTPSTKGNEISKKTSYYSLGFNLTRFVGVTNIAVFKRSWGLYSTYPGLHL